MSGASSVRVTDLVGWGRSPGTGSAVAAAVDILNRLRIGLAG